MNKIVVDKNKLNNYKLKITTLSPVHIGTGEVYEPTNFVIANDTLYKFDEVLFYKSLNESDKKAFNNKLNNYMQIIDFYKSKKDEAKQIANFECKVSNKVNNTYDRQRNRDGTVNRNQLEIQTTYKNPNTSRAIIPGSSIKGMLDTTMKIYPKKIKENDIRQNLILSDAILLHGGVEIGYANRRHRDPRKSSKDGIYQIIEVIKPHSEFVFTIDSKQTFDDIKKSMKDYHQKRKNTRYQETSNSFVGRVGKNVGMDYVVETNNVDGLKNKDQKPLATHFLYDSDILKDEQFGWIKIEIISDEEYCQALKDISVQEKEYYHDIELKQQSIKEEIKKAKEEALRIAKEKEQKAKEEARLEAEQKAKREADLAAMSPIDKIIDSYGNEVSKVIQAMQANEIENLEDIKIELAKKLKEIMKQDPKQWDKAKQKALKRKAYIESIVG